jgi:hypothetical protein
VPGMSREAALPPIQQTMLPIPLLRPIVQEPGVAAGQGYGQLPVLALQAAADGHQLAGQVPRLLVQMR